jgi:hypothetical protein
MLNLWIPLSLLWLIFAVPLQAQQVVDPLEKTVQAQVQTVSSLLSVNNQVYFVAELKSASTPTALMKFNPADQQLSKVADIPDELQLLPTVPVDRQDLREAILVVRDQLLMPGYRQWFDPVANTFKSTFAKAPPSFKAYCELLWDKDLLLVCSDEQGYERQQQNYRFNKADALFYPTEQINERSYHYLAGRDLLCNLEVCGDLLFLTSYQNQPDAKLHIQQEHLYWVQTNGDVIVQSRKNGDLQKLDLNVLATEQLNQESYIAFSADYVLFQTSLPDGPTQIKRLHLPSQRIDVIDTTEDVGPAFAIKGKSIGSDGAFLLWNQWWDKGLVLRSWRLTSQDTKLTIVQKTVIADGSSNDVYDIEVTLLGDGAFITSDTCNKWHLNYVFIRSIGCKVSDSPGFIYVSNQLQTPVTLKSVTSRPATPIRQLTSWNQQLFWHETDEQPRFKRLQPRTGQIDIVATDKSGQLLKGTSALWLYSDSHFYRFNPATNRFDSSGIDGAKGPAPAAEAMGMLVDDNFYYFVNDPLFIESSSLNRFNLNSGQHQTLGLFSNLNVARILGIHQGKIYLSYLSYPRFDYIADTGGVLDLTTLSIEQNDALAPRTASGGMINYSDRLMRVFVYQQQLFGFSTENYYHDWGSGSSTHFSKLDLAQQVRIPLDAGSDHSGRAIIVNDTILTGAGEQFRADGKWIGQPLNERFHQAITFTDSTYLLGDGLQKLQSTKGTVQVQPISLGTETTVNSSSTMAEVGGKLYVVAVDKTQGERIRQIQLDNRAPVALDDTASTTNTTAITIDVLKNDSDPDFDILSVVDAKAIHGSVTIQPNQQLSYQPTAGFVGSDDISYSIADGRNGQHSAKVTVNVSAAPVVTPEKPEQPATPDSGKSGGTLSAAWLYLLITLVALRRLRTKPVLTKQNIIHQPVVKHRKSAQGQPIMRHILRSFILLFACANPLLAQQVIDPIEDTAPRAVSALKQDIFVLDEQVYFVGQLDSGTYAILKLDHTTQQSQKMVDLPLRFIEAGLQLSKIGDRLLINNQMWFKPGSAELSSAVASLRPQDWSKCYFGWNEGILLLCNDGQTYRLDQIDMQFYADNSAATSIDRGVFQQDGLFCRSRDSSYFCTESGSMHSYEVVEKMRWWRKPSIQQNYIFFETEDQVLMQKRHSNIRTTLNIAALSNEKYYSIEAFSPDYILFSVGFQLKRLHIPTQRIDLIDTRLLGDSILSSATLSDNGTFLLLNYAQSTFKLNPSQTTLEVIGLVRGQKQEPYLNTLAWVQLSTPGSLDYEVITIADSCVRLGRYFNYLACRDEVPRLQRFNAQQVIDIPVRSVQSKPVTPIRQLTSWNKQLFWYEYNGQWQVKRYLAQTGRTDIVDTDIQQSFKEPEDRKLLAGTTTLWQLKKNEFYRFNVESNKFDANGTQGAKAKASQGVLIDNDFYYFVLLPSAKNPQGFSSSFRKFNLLTGQYQELKLFDDVQIRRILNVSQGKFYLTFRVPPPYPARGGILHLNNLTIEYNDGLAFGEILSVFEYQQQLFGLSWGYVHSGRQEFIQINLANQSPKTLDFSYITSVSPRAVVLGSSILTSWGSIISTNGDAVSTKGYSFHQALHYQEYVYLLGDKLQKIRLVDGTIQAEQIPLPDGVLIDPTSTIAELEGKLYLVAKDTTHGERIWQVSP